MACATLLNEIQKSCCVVLDYDYEILKEYMRNLVNPRQPGIGFQFWKWLLANKKNTDHCQYVRITKLEQGGYAEFPDHKGLTQFDPSDRKFVAVAIAHGEHPPIYQATDSKWISWEEALQDCGVTVEFVCKKEIEAQFKKKMMKQKKRANG